MSDNLRDRIAAVLYERHYRLDGHPRVRLDLGFDDLEPEIRNVYLADADAVITALKNDPSIMFMTHVCGEGCTCE